MHHQDHESLLSFLGQNGQITPALAEAVEQLWRMAASCGHNGPVGPLGLALVLRSFGYEPPVRGPEKVEEVPWHLLPQDGSVRVEAWIAKAGSWMPGVFLGFSQNGVLAVRLDDVDWIHEIRRDRVRLVKVVAPEEVPIEEPKSARLEKLEQMENVTDRVSEAEEEEVEEEEQEATPAEEPDEDETPVLVERQPQPGDKLWVTVYDDVEDAVCMVVEDGVVKAKLDSDGSVVEVPIGEVAVAS